MNNKNLEVITLHNYTELNHLWWCVGIKIVDIGMCHILKSFFPSIILSLTLFVPPKEKRERRERREGNRVEEMGGVKRLISWVIGNEEYIVWKNKMYLALFEDSIPGQLSTTTFQTSTIITTATSPHYLTFISASSITLTSLSTSYAAATLILTFFCPDLNFPPPPQQQSPYQPLPESPS